MEELIEYMPWVISGLMMGSGISLMFVAFFLREPKPKRGGLTTDEAKANGAPF